MDAPCDTIACSPLWFLTAVGSTQKQTQAMWVLDPATQKIVSRTVTYVPGLYKIFDEILVNAADNKTRDASMNALRVTIDAASNVVSVWNNGEGRGTRSRAADSRSSRR